MAYGPYLLIRNNISFTVLVIHICIVVLIELPLCSQERMERQEGMIVPDYTVEVRSK